MWQILLNVSHLRYFLLFVVFSYFFQFANLRLDMKAAYATDFNWCEQTCERGISKVLMVELAVNFNKKIEDKNLWFKDRIFAPFLVLSHSPLFQPPHSLFPSLRLRKNPFRLLRKNHLTSPRIFFLREMPESISRLIISVQSDSLSERIIGGRAPCCPIVQPKTSLTCNQW